VNAVLSQEIGWFDTCGASELSTKLADLIGKVLDIFCYSFYDFIYCFILVFDRFKMEQEEKLVI
jgi:hypothetical protein